MSKPTDTEMLDWIDTHRGCEPRRSWCSITYRHEWVWMGRNFATLREAVAAAMKEKTNAE